MKKTLFIKVDNTPVPAEANNDVIVLDCTMKNDFCSLIGYELVDGLSDETGKPIYRLIHPSCLLSDYEGVDLNGFAKIISQWQDILMVLLHKGNKKNTCELKMPDEYVHWLLNNENQYYAMIGDTLQHDSLLAIGEDLIYEEIVFKIKNLVLNILSKNKDNIETIVFSNSLLSGKSDISIQLKMNNISIVRYDSWSKIYEQQDDSQQILKIDNNEKNYYNIDDLHFGESDVSSCGCLNKLELYGHKMDYYKNYLYEFRESNTHNCLCSFNDDNLLNGIIVQRKQRLFNKILQTVSGKLIEPEFMSYNEMCDLLITKGFLISDPPHIEEDERNKLTHTANSGKFQCTLYKESRNFIVKILFFQDYKIATNNNRQMRENGGIHSKVFVNHPPLGESMAQMDTLHSITILMKPYLDDI